MIDAVCARLGFGPELRTAVTGSLTVHDRLPALRRLAAHLHHRLATSPFAHPIELAWPRLPADLGEGSQFALLHVLLARVPALLAFHRKIGIPEQVSLDTLDDVLVWIEDHRRKHGSLGFSNPGWLTTHITGRIYRLGRLQFEMVPFWYDVHVHRRRRPDSGCQGPQVITLAGDGCRFRADGQYADADGGAGRGDADDAFTSRYGVDERHITGHPITARGAAMREPVSLDAAAWEHVLGASAPALSVHIPATGAMDHDQCGESMRRAAPFFTRHFPRWNAAAFACASWLLDATLEELLPPSSNIVRFLGEFHLLPHPRACDAQMLERVFGGPLGDLDAAPCASSLQRAIVAHLRAGKRLREAGGFMLVDDLEWGARVYRCGERER